MKVRFSLLLKAFALLTGLLFLNLSFLLTELDMLGLDHKNYALYTELVRMISSGIEEEADNSSGQVNEIQSDTHLFFQFNITILSNNPLIASCKIHHKNDSDGLLYYREIFSPPPEV